MRDKAPKTIVVGGGIIGLATAFRLVDRYPEAHVTVLEKEKAVGQHQSSHNSGVLHCGLYYKPGSVKSRMAVEGIREMVAFCAENGIDYEICGKLVVAAGDSEIPRLRALQERGTANGLQGLRWLGPEEMREHEPYVGGVAALHVPQEGIVDYTQVCGALVKKIEARGGRVVTAARVARLDRRGSEWVAQTNAGDFQAAFLINCAGLQSDRVAQLAGEPRRMRILPFRGEYYHIKRDRQFLVRNLIYPVPDPKFPFLGVHFTRLIHGGREAGPNAVLATAREGYRKTDFSPVDLWDALSYPGLWKFVRRYPSMAWFELRRSFSRDLFCRSLQRLVPEIRSEDLEEGGAGVRAQAITPSGELEQDFNIIGRKDALHVLNAPSPGATASLAIGAEIVSRMGLRPVHAP